MQERSGHSLFTHCSLLFMNIQRTSYGQSPFVEDVGVDHGGADVLMAQEFLDGSNVVPLLQKMRGKAVAKGMAGDRLDDTDYLSGIRNSTV